MGNLFEFYFNRHERRGGVEYDTKFIIISLLQPEATDRRLMDALRGSEARF